MKKIERKWLLPSSFQLPARQYLTYNIVQGYLAAKEGVEVRLRRIDGEDCFITVKTDESTVSSDIWQVEIPAHIFELLWPMTIDRRIEKTRHVFIDNNNDQRFEIDFFKDRLDGLVILSCNFLTGDESGALTFELPDWVQTHAVDITSNSQFRNRNLASNPLGAIVTGQMLLSTPNR